MKHKILVLSTLMLAPAIHAASFTEVATKGAIIGTTNLFDGNASTGGNDADSAGTPETFNFDRTWSLSAPDGGGVDVSITGLAFGVAGNQNTNGNVITATIIYLGADGVFGGMDDLVLGSAKATLVYTTAFDGTLVGRYEWLFDTPITGTVGTVGSNFRVRLESLEADNAAVTYNMRFKTTSGTAASAVKMDVTGTSTPNGLVDADSDGIHDGFETNTGIYVSTTNTGTNPALADTDLDGLNDGVENNTNIWVSVSKSGTSPVKNDSDNDGLLDGVETNTGTFVSTTNTGTSPVNRDKDNDRLSDGYEVTNGLNAHANADFDTDTFSDALEVLFYNSDPKNVASLPGVGASPAPGSFTPLQNSGVTVLTAAQLPTTLVNTIINEAATGGGDASYTAGVTDFVVKYPNAFPAAGSTVSITGFAWPVTAANNSSGDILLQFFDPGANGVIDGIDKDTLVGTAKGTLTVTGATTIMYWNFTPINFTSSGTALMVKIQSTAAMNLKTHISAADGQWFTNSGVTQFSPVRESAFSIGGTVTAPGGYSSWKTANSTIQTIDQDHDNDGVSNGVEFFISGPIATSGFTPLPSVVSNLGTLSVTWAKAAGYTGVYGTDFVVETSASLATGNWNIEPNPGATISFPTANEVKYTFPTGTKNFARLKVTGP